MSDRQRYEKKLTSLAQFKYYHGCVVSLLSCAFRLTPEQTHSVLTNKFLSKEIYLPLVKGVSQKVILTRSTKELSTNEMEEYLSKIRQWASKDFDIFIAKPNGGSPHGR